MAILKSKDISKMDRKEMESKLKDLRMELIKANVSANKTNAKTKEIKRAISRLITFQNSTSKDVGDKDVSKSAKEELKTKK